MGEVIGVGRLIVLSAVFHVPVAAKVGKHVRSALKIQKNEMMYEKSGKFLEFNFLECCYGREGPGLAGFLGRSSA